VIVENTTLLEGTKRSQVVKSKCKEIAFGDEERYWPLKKAKRKYCRDNTVKMEGANIYKRCVHARHDCLVYHSR